MWGLVNIIKLSHYISLLVVVFLLYKFGVIVGFAALFAFVALLIALQKMVPAVGYRLLGPLYDRFMEGFESAYLANLRRRYVPMVRGRTLELGAGTGNSLQYFPNKCAVTLVDPAASMLAEARIKAQLRPDLELEFVCAAGESLPFPNASFDTVLAIDTFCSVRDSDSCMRELHRVLKPGGRAIFVEHYRTYSFLKDLQLLFVTLVFMFPLCGASLVRDTDKVIRTHFPNVIEERRHAQSFRAFICERPK